MDARGSDQDLDAAGLTCLAPVRAGLAACGHSHGNAIEPPPDRALDANRAGLAHQDQESRLKGVFGIVRIGQNPPADAQHHRSVTLHERGKGKLGRFVATGQESLQKLSVGESAQALRLKKDLNLPRNRASVWLRHRPGPRSCCRSLPNGLATILCRQGRWPFPICGNDLKAISTRCRASPGWVRDQRPASGAEGWHRRRENRP